MLFGFSNIVSFAGWPATMPDPEERDFSELVIEESNGDLLCELSISRDRKKHAGCHILIPAPLVYAVTLGDVMSQSFIAQILTSGIASSLIYEAVESSYVNSLLAAEPALCFTKLRHFVIPSNDRWLHVLMDEEPYIQGSFVADAEIGPRESLQ